ncbi:MAG: type II secretion system F family protein [Sphingomonadales bacterium]
MNGTINPDLIVSAIFFGVLIVGIAVSVVINSLNSPNRKMQQRIGGIRERFSNAPKTLSAISTIRLTGDSATKGMDAMLHSLVPRPAELRRRLAQTGLDISLNHYVIANIVLTIMVTILFFFVFAFSGLLSVLLGVVLGMGLPHHVLGRLIARRLAKFTRLFPDAIDLIVRGLRSGLPITESMGSVGEEIEDPVGIEFRRTIDAIKLGRNPDEALADTAERLNTPDFRFFMISLSIQRETGGNLAETLENLSDILRRRHQMKLKIKAMSSEARASAIIIGSLPFVMLGILMLINYDYVSALFTDPRGMVMSGVGLFMMGLGAGVISKMVKFEI